jgi:hypothetical protein
MSDFYGALDDEGVVHSLEKTPIYKTVDGYTRTQAMGFTWCMHVFTWKEGPRYHSLLDGAELRYTQTLGHTTCLTCIAAESGVDLLA